MQPGKIDKEKKVKIIQIVEEVRKTIVLRWQISRKIQPAKNESKGNK